MKKVIKTVAIFLALGTMFTGCLKEDYANVTDINTEVSAARTISYSVNGVVQTVTVNSNEELEQFIRQLLALAREGYEVSCYDTSLFSGNAVSKEVVTYNAKTEAEAVAWTLDMMAQGYLTSYIYDKENGVYVCTAIK